MVVTRSGRTPNLLGKSINGSNRTIARTLAARAGEARGRSKNPSKIVATNFRRRRLSPIEFC
jgi:hypothetical protein